MALSNPLKGERKAGTVGKPLPGVQVSWSRTLPFAIFYFFLEKISIFYWS